MTTRRIGIILSTTRNARFADRPAEWVLRHLQSHRSASAEIIDLRDYPMPFFADASPPAAAMSSSEAAQRWASKVSQMDGFVFVTAEYNHGIPAVLKNALDHAYLEFNKKPAAFVGYGGLGAARSIEQLRLVCVELQMAPLRNAVHIVLEQYLAVSKGQNRIDDFPFLVTSLNTAVEDLLWWTNALARAREASA